MAIGTPVERYQAALTSQGATTTLSPASTIAAGTVAFLFVGGINTAKNVASVSDDAGGNTWVVDKEGTSSEGVASVVSCQVATQITAANTITITYGVATAQNRQVWIQEVSGLATSNAFDQFAVGAGTGTTPGSGNTPTLSQADELVWGVLRGGFTTWTKGASYTNVATPQIGGGSALEYKIVAATTAVAANGTLSGGSTVYVIICATYKGASGTTYDDAASGTITTSAGASSESKLVADAHSGTIALSGTASESYSISFDDSRAGAIVASGTKVESLVFTDAMGAALYPPVYPPVYPDERAVIQLGGTAVEEFIEGSPTFNDARSGTIVLSAGAHAESHVHTASASGTIVISGTAFEQHLGAGPAEDSHLNLGGIYDQAIRSGIYGQAIRSGNHDESLTGGVVAEPVLGGSFDESVTGGVFDESLTGGEHDESERSAQEDESLLSGAVL